jgi:hypothetical protein
MIVKVGPFCRIFKEGSKLFTFIGAPALSFVRFYVCSTEHKCENTPYLDSVVDETSENRN